MYKNFLGALLLGTIFFIACTKENQEQQTPIPLSVVQVKEQDVEDYEYYVADIQAVKNVEIRTKVAGFLEQIFVDEGKKVSKGQPLFKINDLEYKAEVATANANLQTATAEAHTAEIEVERVKLLVDKKVVSEVELKMAEAKWKASLAKVEEARAELQKAELKLSYTIIHAPFDGLIDRIPLKIGSLLQEGTLLTTISDNSYMYAYFKITENEYLEYMKKRQLDTSIKQQVVKLVLSNNSVYAHEGVIETLEGDFEGGSGSIAFRAKFPNPDRLLKHGATGKVLASKKIQKSILIPQKAVMEIQDKNYVFVLDKNNKTQLRSFIPLKRRENFYIVKSGLKVGEKIVVEGIQGLKEGVSINPKIISVDSLLAENL
ncbi:efflux RND transporter periplasmic adaptor subunit [Raineya orbicola]|jgi:membrane fusion protein (multidrug efflux system)|uniref:Efflux transporter, RND family, MFP subunit n=1 Tax=Raineya orbicola TaxID=2016530 RepID=A0A2N3IDA4_9BACT|nr:efflux RND transporter periplasmic adaptor subunit [Raineya orbicola]PKQ68301.1 Efflux transporter, RND family, MFP subunit [Raineya orbicola]